MTSLPRQVRLQAFTAGCAAVAGLYVYTRNAVRDAMEDTAAQLPGAAPRKVAPPPQAPAPIFGAPARAWVVRRWNEGVDAVFKPLVAALSSRNL